MMPSVKGVPRKKSVILFFLGVHATVLSVSDQFAVIEWEGDGQQETLPIQELATHFVRVCSVAKRKRVTKKTQSGRCVINMGATEVPMPAANDYARPTKKRTRRKIDTPIVPQCIHQSVTALATHMCKNQITFNETSQHLNHELCSPTNNNYFNLGPWRWLRREMGADVLVVPGITKKKDFVVGFNAFELDQLESVVNCIALKGVNGYPPFETKRD
jgi:hypothetical protein